MGASVAPSDDESGGPSTPTQSDAKKPVQASRSKWWCVSKGSLRRTSLCLRSVCVSTTMTQLPSGREARSARVPPP